jgi:hypothetical protein
MIKKLVSELEGAELDYFVAFSEGLTQVRITSDISIGIKPYCYFYDDERNFSEGDFYPPSLNWAQAGPLIEKYGISLMHRFGKEGVCNSYYHAQVGPEEPENETLMTHEKPLVAAMRSFVASKFGKYVYLPSHRE